MEYENKLIDKEHYKTLDYEDYHFKINLDEVEY